ncbi:hypothetical protein DSO57_1017830 [Entomophthora muscae]|uniref:Uncharacterized protein n=1 Tax=Entomophthora muscae TaxID=34485 RepID=A0ACC2T4I2_9FUNG|nr:hypothetical protein DSO57_1017830 [Entomophthora muscae]
MSMRIASVILLGLAAAGSDDVEALNLAITMEHVKSSFYQEYSSALGGNAVSRLLANTNDYLTVLSRAVQALGGAPLQKCTYNFRAYPTTHSPSGHALMLARGFEAASIQVYNALQKALVNPKIREVVAAMATSQGSHKAYLNSLARQDPLVESFESSMSPRQGISFFKRYTASCPFSVMGGTFPALTLRPDMGYAGSRVLGAIISSRAVSLRSASPQNSTKTIPVLDLRSLLAQSTGADSEIEDDLEADSETKANDSPTYEGLARSESTESSGLMDSARANRYPDSCVFVVGNRQKFSEYAGGCIVPQNLPSGLAFVYVVREQVRVSSAKNDHVVAGPAIFDILGHNSYQSNDNSVPFTEGFNIGPESS